MSIDIRYEPPAPDEVLPWTDDTVTKHADHDQSTHGNWARTKDLKPTQSMAETLHGRTFEERSALRASIKEEGIKEPILVMSPTDLRIQDGHQRHIIARSLRLEDVPITYVFSKHYGPGPHPGTGTEQNVHGHGAGFLEPMQGEAQLNTKPTQAFLVTEDGSHPHVTMKGLEEMKQLKGGKVRKIAARNEILDKIKATMSTYDITDADMDTNLRTVLDSAMARYADHPELIEADKFYQHWHEELLRISEAHDRDFDDVIAAAAAISPGLNADDNLQFAGELAELVNENPTFSEIEANALATQFQGNAYMLRNPVYTEHHKEVIDGKVEIGTPRGPETRPSVLAVASQLDADADALRNASDAQLLDLSNEGAARAAHWLRQQKKGAGFQVKTYSYYADAIEVLRDGETTANETLRGIKTRSFYNNILDPDNDFGRNDVTVDFHTINFAAFGLGADANTHIQGTPSYGSVSLGVRPAVADAVRRLEPYARERHNQNLHGSRLQEILWAEWRRGTSATGRGSSTWVSYDGTTYDLKDLSG